MLKEAIVLLRKMITIFDVLLLLLPSEDEASLANEGEALKR